MNYGTTDESNLPEETVVERLIDPTCHPVRDVLHILLQDKSTKKNIIWATDAYSSHGDSCSDKNPMFPEAFSTGNPVVLMTRSEKEIEEQRGRTRVKAEVFTPGWVCNLMNNYCDEVWFGYKDVFNTVAEDRTWTANPDCIRFPDGRNWKHYIDSRRLEITCGEAPFLASRYDVSTGDLIYPLTDRVGALDRKLRVVNENAESREEWEKWILRAFQSCYGYEWQGDNLLIARINLLMTFHDYYTEKWGEEPDSKLLRAIAQTIAWNLWQMDGLTDTVPFGKPFEPVHQMTLFDDFGTESFKVHPETVSCKIYDWRRDNSTPFHKCKERVKMNKKKLFDFVIGNPPYQEMKEDNTRQPPIYNKFMDAAYELSTSSLLITPSRFLFDAGQTPSEWNRKMLNDPHFKVILYEMDAKKVFPNTDIKGGVAIHYRDEAKDFGKIELFYPFDELKSIHEKVKAKTVQHLDQIVSSRGQYRFSDEFYKDNPDAKSKVAAGTANMLASNVFKSIPEVFSDSPNSNSLKIYGIFNKERIIRYIPEKWIIPNPYSDTFNVLITESNNAGKFGETLTDFIICKPKECTSDSYISIGCFDSEDKAINLTKALKTKFFRAMLGIKKVTQHNPQSVWDCVPLEDFSTESDIDWSKSIEDIDQQLYRKYGLSDDEISFIESHVKEMT